MIEYKSEDYIKYRIKRARETIEEVQFVKRIGELVNE